MKKKYKSVFYFKNMIKQDYNCGESRAWGIFLVFSLLAVILWFFEPLIGGKNEQTR